MVKQVLQSAADEVFLQKLTTLGRCTAGVLVGNCTETDKDYIAGYIECPDRENEESNPSVSNIDDSWFAAYCSQVALNLPGGISIIGIFICAEPSDAKDAANKLKSLALRTHQMLSKMSKECWTYSTDQQSTTWTLIHFNLGNSQTVSVKQHDIKTRQDIGQTIELKRLPQNIAWSNLEASLDICQDLAVQTKSVQFDTFHQLCNQISQAHVILDNESRLENQILDPTTSQAGKASKNKKNLKRDTPKIFHCQLYLPVTDNFDGIIPTDTSSSVKAKMQGSILAQAFVPPGSTVKVATDALKSDVIRSLQQRCLITNDSCDELDSEKTSFCQLPLRVLAKDDKNPAGLYFSEYLIQGEPISDCIDRFREMIGITVQENALVNEYFKEYEKPVVENLSTCDSNDVEEQQTGSINSKMMMMFIAILGIVIGLCLLLVKS